MKMKLLLGLFLCLFSCSSGIGNAASTEAPIQQLIPVAGQIKELRCRASTANDSDESWTITVRTLRANTTVTINTLLACTIGVSAQTCSNLVNTVPVEIGDLVSFFVDNTAGASPSIIVRCSSIVYEYR